MYIASLDFYTKPNPSYHLMATMLEDVLNSGIEVLFLGCSEEGVPKHIPDFLERHPLFTYHLVLCSKVEKTDFVFRYLNGIRYSVAIGKLVKQYINECDMVFVQSSPTVLYTLLYVKKYARKKKVIYNVQDMFPGSSIASGVMPLKWMQVIFYRLQKIAYKKSDIITAISEDMKAKLIDQGVEKDKIKVILNWFDDSSVHEVSWSDNRFVKKYNMSQEKFYVQYAGTMGYVFDYEMVISVAKKLKEHKDIVFQMIGEGSQKDVFIQTAKEEGLNNIVFLPLESQEMVSDVYSACSVCFIPLKKGIIGNSVPSKAGLVMACKRAIITSVDENSDYYNMVSKYAGVAVANNDPDGIVRAILYMKDNRVVCTQYGKSGYEYGHELYSRSKNMKKYLDLFNECVIKNNAL